MLTIIGKSMYGTKYSFDGILPGSFFDFSTLKFGDVIIDNNGKGRHIYANKCCSCKQIYLASTLIISPEPCNDCDKPYFLR